MDFDDDTDKLYGTFPIPRRLLASVLDRIAKGSPGLIGLDVLLDEARQPPEDDRELAAALARAGNVVLAESFGTAHLPASKPLPEFRQHALAVGFANLPVDNDGFIRRMFLWRRTAEYEGLSLPLSLASAYWNVEPEPSHRGGLRLGDHEIRLDDTESNTALIACWSSESANRISVARLLTPDFGVEVFKGKIVLVGQSGTRGKDLYATPLFRSANTGERRLRSGLEIHAAGLATLLTRKAIRVLDSRYLWTLNFLLATLIIALLVMFRPAYGALLAAGALLGTYALAQTLLSSQGLWMRFASTEAAIILALPAGLGYRFLEERRLKSLAETARQHESEQRQRLEQELVRARTIQQSLLPQAVPDVDGFDMAVRYQSSLLVGGDYYDFLLLDPSKLFVIVADVEGKGTASALVMSNFQATLHAAVQLTRSLEDLVGELNDSVLRNTQGSKFITLFLGLLDLPRRELRYVTAGHIPPMVVRTGGERLRLTEGGMVLGLFPAARYEAGTVQLRPGDILLACTDGITEACDSNGQQFEIENLVRTACAQRQQPAAKIVEAILAEVEIFSAGGAHHDDKVIVVLKAL